MPTSRERDRVRDPDRLADVRDTGLLDGPPSPSLQRFTEAAVTLLRVPAAQVTLVDDCRAVRVASTGLEALGVAGQVPIGSAPCLRVVVDDQPVLLTDIDAGPVRAWAGAPVRSAEGRVLGSLCALDHVARTWSDDDEHVLAALADAVSVELALHVTARRERDALARADFQATLLRATNEATPDGILVVSPEGRRLSWNTRFQTVWPIEPDAVASGSDDVATASVLRTVADPDAFTARVESLYADRQPGRDEIQLRDGRVLDRYGAPLYGDDGTYHGFVWFVRDISEERQARQALEASEARYRSLLQALTNEVWRTSPRGELIDDMPRWRSFTGQTREQLLGSGWVEGIHPDDRERARRTWERAVDTLSTYESEYRICRVGGPGDDVRRLQVRGVPLVRDGQVVEWVGVYVDVTELRAAEEAEQRLAARAAAAAESTRVLQEVTAALSGAVSTADVMSVVLAKGQELLGASGGGVALRHGDRVRYELLTGYSAEIKSSWAEFDYHEDTPVTRAIRTGLPSFVSSTADLLEAFPDSERLRAFVEASGEQAFARLPLRTPSGVLGVLVFGFEQARPFPPEERQFLLALAGQCAQALERARLYERERETARMLQRSLLPDALPLVLGLRLSAVCETHTADMEVGGDWYDAIALPDGRIAVSVGDVRGRGVRAASVMGQVRNAVRGLVHADPSPDAVLGWLDAVVHGLRDDEEFVTFAYAVADPATGSLEWAGAGHMPPMVVSGTGARYLTGGESLPLGLGGARSSARLVLQPGEALVLFSDGLVENRHRPLDVGLARLLEHATALAPQHPTAEGLRDGLTRAMVDEGATDDVTVLTLRRAHDAHGVGRSPLAAQVDLPAHRTSPAAARQFVGARLGEWGARGVLDETLLCVSELVTNAVVHAMSAVHLQLHCGEGVLRVDVRDTGRPVVPVTRPAAAEDDTHGRGLLLVEVISDRWGVVEEADGKVVWFELEVPAV